MADDNRTWQGFTRQRRNLLIISLVLLFAQVADLSLIELNVLGNRVAIGQPATIVLALWAAWAYWLIRYIQYYHDLGDKHFQKAYRARMRELVVGIASRQIKRTGTLALNSPPEWPYRLQLDAGTAVSYESKWRYILNPVLVAHPLQKDPLTNPVFEQKKGYEVTNRWLLAIAHARAWMYVIFRTHLFSEYVLPYMVAGLPVAYFLYEKL